MPCVPPSRATTPRHATPSYMYNRLILLVYLCATTMQIAEVSGVAKTKVEPKNPHRILQPIADRYYALLCRIE